MKKLMIAMVAVALATVANAAASYNYNTFSNVGRYTVDGGDNKNRYTGYAMTQATAQSLVGTQGTVTYTSFANWIATMGYADAKTAIAGAGQTLQTWKYDGSVGTYGFEAYSPSTTPDRLMTDAIGVFFYQDDAGYLAYNVYSGGTPPGGLTNWLTFDTAKGSSATGWQTTQVPEPTSGLLLLLGVAGLALKRKQK